MADEKMQVVLRGGPYGGRKEEMEANTREVYAEASLLDCSEVAEAVYWPTVERTPSGAVVFVYQGPRRINRGHTV